MRVSGVRWREDTGFELRCETCAQDGGQTTYWPLTLEFWNPRDSMRFCRACLSRRRRVRERARSHADPEYRARKRADALYQREAKRVYQREYRRQNAARLGEYNRLWYAANRDRINARRREQYRRLQEELAA